MARSSVRAELDASYQEVSDDLVEQVLEWTRHLLEAGHLRPAELPARIAEIAAQCAQDFRTERELDRRTIAAAQLGSQWARNLIGAKYRRRAFLAIRANLPNDCLNATEDLCHEAFKMALRHLSRFDPDGSAQLSTWIIAIGRQLARNHARLTKRRAAVTAKDSPDEIAQLPAPECTEGDAVAKQERAIFAQQIAALASEYRAVLELRLEDYKISEIAEILDLPEGTVKSRLSRACRVLRERLSSWKR